PDELLAHLDDLVDGLMRPDGSPASADGQHAEAGAAFMGATCLYAVYDPVSGCCTMARAGHLPPLVVRPDGTAELLDLPAGPPLGVGSLHPASTELRLAEGPLLAFFTGGLAGTHARDIAAALARLTEALTAPGPPPLADI